MSNRVQATQGERRRQQLVTELYAVIAAGNGHNVGNAKLALIRYVRRNPFFRLSNKAWRIITDLLTSRSAKRRKFWQEVFVQVCDDFEDLATITSRLVRARFVCPVKQFHAMEAAGIFEQGALNVTMTQYNDVVRNVLAQRQQEAAAMAA